MKYTIDEESHEFEIIITKSDFIILAMENTFDNRIY